MSIFLAILFLVKLRLGAQVNIYDHIRSRYGGESIRVLRKFENYALKDVKARLDLEFLQKCKVYNVFPKFLRFKLYKKALQSSNFYRAWQSKLLVNEIQSKRKLIKDMEGKLEDARELVRTTFSAMDAMLVRRDVAARADRSKVNIQNTHRKKLESLGISNQLQPCDPERVVLNFSSVQLSTRLKFLLAFGLDFNLPVHKLNFFRYFLDFESLINRLSIKDCQNFSDLTDRIRELAFRHYYNFKPYKVFSAIFSSADLKLLRQFSRNKEVITCKPDKGNAVVLVDRSTYVASMMSIVSDSSKFSPITESVQKVTQRIEDKLNNFLRKLKSSGTIDVNFYKQVSASGSGPGILYGLPKIHKADFSTKFQFRPIFAAYNLPTFNLAKYLVGVLSPFTTSEYTVENSRTFVEDLRLIEGADKLYMASYDVVSLFTNVPLSETIDICLNYLFNNVSSVEGLNRELFGKMLELAVMNSFFVFNGKLFKQIEGLGMGLPLGPTFANIFMSFHEKSWLADCPDNFKPVFYRRYVDDTFVLFRNQSHAQLFLDYINSKHSNINFTMDCEVDNKLPFLDCSVYRSGNHFECSVFRKDTFTGMGTSFFSNCTFNFKINSIQTLLYRAFNVCTSYSLLHKEFVFLKDFFFNNGFPRFLIDKFINRFLCRKFSPPNAGTLPVDNFYFKIPYFGAQTDKLKTELSSVLKHYFPDINFRIVLRNSFKIGSLFNYKDKLSPGDRHSVVYQYCCARCASVYVGSTTRTLHVRMAEHSGRSFRTGNILAHPSHSNIRIHAEQCDSPVISNNFKILDSVNHPIDLRLLESLYIFKVRPKLNENLSAFPLRIVGR